MVPPIEFQRPLPSRQAASALRDQLVDYLTKHQFALGARLPTETDLCKLSGLSRSTVRRDEPAS